MNFSKLKQGFDLALEKRAVSRLNSAAKSVKKVGNVEKARVAMGHVLGQTAGGAVLGGVGNAAVYGSQGEGIGGAYTMPEAFIGGAMAGALAGAAIGAFGAKGAANRVVASSAKAQKKFGRLTDSALGKPGVRAYRDAASAVKSGERRLGKLQRRFDKKGSLTPEEIVEVNNIKADMPNNQAMAQKYMDRLNDRINYLESIGASKRAIKGMRTHLFSKPVNGRKS